MIFKEIDKKRKPRKEWCYFAAGIRACEMDVRPQLGSKICLGCMEERIALMKIKAALETKLKSGGGFFRK